MRAIWHQGTIRKSYNLLKSSQQRLFEIYGPFCINVQGLLSYKSGLETRYVTFPKNLKHHGRGIKIKGSSLPQMSSNHAKYIQKVFKRLICISEPLFYWFNVILAPKSTPAENPKSFNTILKINTKNMRKKNPSRICHEESSNNLKKQIRTNPKANLTKHQKHNAKSIQKSSNNT